MFKNSHTILDVFGIPIRIAPSWILIAALITWSLTEHSLPALAPDQPFAAILLAAIVAMLLFFSSLLLHELAHAMVAKSFGIDVPSITLFLFGGVAELGDEPDTPHNEFWIAIAGPVMSFVLAIMYWSLWSMGSVFLGPLELAVLFYLALINLVLAVFNLIPAFPLDGGRVLRAVLWARHGDILKATEQSARMGEFLAFALIGLGLLGLFQGAQMAGAWQILIGIFILLAARSCLENQRLKSYLGDMTVAKLMTQDAITTSPDTTLSHLVNRVMLPYRISFVPVVESEELLGYIDAGVIANIDRENWTNTQVDDVFVKLDPEEAVSPDGIAVDVVKRFTETGRRKLLVAEGKHLRGVVTLSDLSRYLDLLSQLHERRIRR